MYLMVLLFLVCLAPKITGQATPQAFASRQEEMRAIGLVDSTHKSIIQAYQQSAVNLDDLNLLLADIQLDRDASFGLVQLVRILSFTDDASLQNQILSNITMLPYWLEKGEETRVYWTENQQSMWMSSAWILQEHHGKDMGGDALRKRLVHYLKLKRDHGFYEFYSSVYFPYTLTGLLNLVDFALDEEIRELAVEAAQKLLQTILLVVNTQGSFDAAAGRNYVDFYLDNERQIHNLIWMLTGLGTRPTYMSHTAAFFATTTLPVEPILDLYDASGVDTSIYAGPSLEESFEINKVLSRLDRTMFQWSMGAYFHPDVAEDTQWVLDELDLWNHGEFADFSAFESLPSGMGNLGSQALASITSSSVLAGAHVYIFRNSEVLLSSVQNYWPGHFGYQQYPCMATTGTKAVWLQSGEETADWRDRRDIPTNTHLPYIEQKSNVALVVYNPNDDIEVLSSIAPESGLGGDGDYQVALRWPDAFDEEAEIGNWKLGREGNGYVAVLRHCLDTVEGIDACDADHQTWAIVVGNSDMYTTFVDFRQKVSASTYSEGRQWSWSRFRKVYHAEIEFDGVKITHSW